MSSGKKLALCVLVALFVLSAIRLLSGPPKARGVIELHVDRHEGLSSAGFETRDAIPIVIHAVGSVGDGADAPELAVYGWILNESTRNPIWVMDSASINRIEGDLAIVEADTILLEPGRYAAFLTSHWDLVSRYRRSATRNREKWNMVIRAANEDVELWARPVTVMNDNADAFWSAAPLENDAHQEFFFEVHRQDQLDIYAVGQLDAESASPLTDYSWIEDVHSGRPVWHLSLDNTEWAGGARENRMFRGSITMQPGVYRVVARTNGRHAFKDWEDNPPYDPSAWGITLTTGNSSAFTRFDPWMDADRDPIISVTRVGDDESHSHRFRVSEPTSVVVWAMGEITSEDGLWDVATLSQSVGGQDVEVWTMDYQSSIHGGGGSKNRVAVKFLQLNPGDYQLDYTSDGSHSYDHWNDDPPNHQERWGVTLFPVSENASDVITVLD